MRTSRLVMSTVLAAGLVGVASPALASNTLNCSDFEYQEEAQAVYDQDTSDPNRLDEGGEEGVACEDLPQRPAGAVEEEEEPTSEPEESEPEESDPEEMAMPSGGVDTGAGGTAGDVTGLLATGGLLAAAGAGGLVLLRRRATD